MALISAAQLAAVRKVAYRGLTTPYSVWRKTRSESVYGTSDTWSEVATGTGWLRMMNKPKTTEQVGNIEGATSNYRFHTDVAVSIEIGDRIRISGVDYEVNDVNSDDTIQVFRTCFLRLIQ